MRLGAGEYYEERSVSHCQLGDVHDGVPFPRVFEVAVREARGRRKRPDDRPSFIVESPVTLHVGVVCHYTCGFLAQPPGTAGYAHEYRLMAPILPLRRLQEIGWKATTLRTVRDQGQQHGVLYVPWPHNDDSSDEWTGHAAALLYRPVLVTQEVLDSAACPRIARMTEQAQHLLALGMIQVVSPMTLDPSDPNLIRPDISDSWEPEGTEADADPV